MIFFLGRRGYSRDYVWVGVEGYECFNGKVMVIGSGRVYGGVEEGVWGIEGGRVGI